MTKVVSILILVVMSTVLTSCATLLTGSTQTVQIVSREENTEIYVNEQYVGDDHVTVILQKNRNYVARGEKQGCKDITAAFSKDISPVTILNLFFWPGFIVDGVTGSWYSFQQSVYTVTPRCS